MKLFLLLIKYKFKISGNLYLTCQKFLRYQPQNHVSSFENLAKLHFHSFNFLFRVNRLDIFIRKCVIFIKAWNNINDSWAIKYSSLPKRLKSNYRTIA